MTLLAPPHTSLVREWAYMWRMAGLSAAFVVFTAPALSTHTERAYPVLTIVFAGLFTAVALTWDRVRIEPVSPAIQRRRVALATGISVIGLSFVAYGWVGEMLWHAYGADMLIVIREAGQRFLSGRDPYFTYRNTYDAPWDLVLPYGPMLWGPYLVPQILRLDLRMVTIVGELFVPAGCAIAAIVEVGARQARLWRGVGRSAGGAGCQHQRPLFHAHGPHAGLLAVTSVVCCAGDQTAVVARGLSCSVCSSSRAARWSRWRPFC